MQLPYLKRIVFFVFTSICTLSTVNISVLSEPCPPHIRVIPNNDKPLKKETKQFLISHHTFHIALRKDISVFPNRNHWRVTASGIYIKETKVIYYVSFLGCESFGRCSLALR